MPLTDVACRNALCPDGKQFARYFDAGSLYLEVRAAGGKYWRWKFTVGGKEKRLSLGVYPAVSLKAAREARDRARLTLSAGQDPAVARRAAKVAKFSGSAETFEVVARQWHAHWKPTRSEYHAAQVLRRLEKDVFPSLGRLPIRSITAPMLIAVVRKIEKRGANDIAGRAWATSSMVFRYAIANDLGERNPAADVKPGDVLSRRKTTNYARIDGKEVPELLRRMAVYQGTPATRAALGLIALTFVRTTELIEAKWSEFDLDAAEWRIPPERMKARVLHIVPLATQAVDILRCLEAVRNSSAYVFPGERDHGRPMSNGTILKALQIMGYKGRMTGHGFRGIASTMLHELRFEPAHIELQLAHTPRDKVAAAYNHARFLPERRQMMQAWADHLDDLRKGGKVMKMRA